MDEECVAALAALLVRDGYFDCAVDARRAAVRLIAVAEEQSSNEPDATTTQPER